MQFAGILQAIQQGRVRVGAQGARLFLVGVSVLFLTALAGNGARGSPYQYRWLLYCSLQPPYSPELSPSSSSAPPGGAFSRDVSAGVL